MNDNKIDINSFEENSSEAMVRTGSFCEINRRNIENAYCISSTNIRYADEVHSSDMEQKKYEAEFFNNAIDDFTNNLNNYTK